MKTLLGFALFAFILGVYQATMVVLKLANLYQADWLVVLAPLGVPLLYVICVMISYLIFGVLYYLILRPHNNKGDLS